MADTSRSGGYLKRLANGGPPQVMKVYELFWVAVLFGISLVAPAPWGAFALVAGWQMGVAWTVRGIRRQSDKRRSHAPDCHLLIPPQPGPKAPPKRCTCGASDA